VSCSFTFYHAITLINIFNSNLLCSWNETINANFDLKRLREIYNNILIFFEMISIDNVPVCWAFLKLFTPHSLNIDKKCKLQFFEYQKTSNSCFSSMFNKNRAPVDLSIFEQWQMNRKKFPCTLNTFLKDLNFAAAAMDEAKSEEIAANTRTSSESIQRCWRKIPGQACKTPNKTFHKLPLPYKGSLVVRFSHDGNFLAFSEVSRHGHLLHINKFPEMTSVFTMLEHSDIIHDIDWLKQKSYEHQRVVTASADFTAIVWKFEESSYTYTILPHPAFVYACKFLQNDSSGKVHVVTGGRDNVVRIWKNRTGMHSFELVQELRHPKTSAVTFIVAIATRNADTFYTATSTADIVEWTASSSSGYQMNRHFRFDELQERLINCMDLNPRGNKICFRIQDSSDFDRASSIYVLGIATGTITQRYQQTNMQRQNQGILTISPCGSQVFSTNGAVIRHYQLMNGSVVAAEDNKNVLKVKLALGEKGFVSSMDYHPKDFYLAISTYGANHSNIIICSYETNEKDPIEQMKVGSQEAIFQKPLEARQIGAFSDIIKRMDEVFMAPPTNDNDDQQSILKIHDRKNSNFEDNTFTVESKRSKTYTVSKGPATFTIQNGTYEIQKNDETDEDETTISESFN
jgi:WD40 repeat protein